MSELCACFRLCEKSRYSMAFCNGFWRLRVDPANHIAFDHSFQNKSRDLFMFHVIVIFRRTQGTIQPIASEVSIDLHFLSSKTYVGYSCFKFLGTREINYNLIIIINTTRIKRFRLHSASELYRNFQMVA